MPPRNQRPLIMGTRGLIVSGHYLATAAGHRILIEGGNAVDAAAAAGLCINVVEQQQAGPGGEVPVLVYSASERKTFAISGVGWSPKAFTIDWCREHGVDLIPGDGYLPACVPAVVGTWAAALDRFGTLSFAQVAQPAIELAERGFPMYDGLRRSLIDHRRMFLQRYPSTAEVYLPEGRVPAIGQLVRNPALAQTFRLLCRAEAGHAHQGRSAGIRAARDAFYRGETAERIVDFITDSPVEDASGTQHAGLLAYDDLAEWQAAVEEPLSLNYRGLDVHKCSSWTQGPVFLQQLALLEGFDLQAMGHNSLVYIHTWLECAKLAFADREAHYGDPLLDDPPFDVLLSKGYADRRRALVGDRASLELRPGDAGRGVPDYATFDVRADNRRALGLDTPAGDAPPATHGGDTSQLDVADAAGNMVAATPSGGWLGSSPLIRGVGFPLGTRGQMFYLNARRPNALAPHKRPRATLTPTLVTRHGEPCLAFGMRGGDVQDQKTLQFFLNHVVFGLDVQSALDAPMVHAAHFPNSFYPRGASPGRAFVDSRIDPTLVAHLRRRGHRVELAHPRDNTMAVRRDPDTGVLVGGVCSTGEHAYALGW